jgi:prepilin-type N-terminal cleavage/methylation domain-containing protein
MRAARKKKSSVLGFTLLELMIALSIFLIIWGSAGYLLIRTSKLIKAVLYQNESSRASIAMRKFEIDFNAPLKSVEGNSQKVVFKTLFDEIIYEFNGKNIYRISSEEELILKNIKDCHWRFLKDGQWFEDWNQSGLPDAISWELKKDREIFQMLYPVRIEK